MAPLREGRDQGLGQSSGAKLTSPKRNPWAESTTHARVLSYQVQMLTYKSKVPSLRTETSRVRKQKQIHRSPGLEAKPGSGTRKTTEHRDQEACQGRSGSELLAGLQAAVTAGTKWGD